MPLGPQALTACSQDDEEISATLQLINEGFEDGAPLQEVSRISILSSKGHHRPT